MRKILFLGENWLGSCARACGAALRRQGAEVVEMDTQSVFPQWEGKGLRALRRLARPWIAAEYNGRIEAAAKGMDTVVAFKGALVRGETLRRLRERGVYLVNYFPDNSIHAHGRELTESLREYDLIAAAHRHTLGQMREAGLGGRLVHLPHGYDADVHRMVERGASREFAVDVAFVGSYSEGKERVVGELARRMPEVELGIWGDGWKERAREAWVAARVRGANLTGQRYARAIGEPKITLGLTVEATPGARQGDAVTTRSLEIPACGGFLLHQRNEEIRGLYEEGEEMACFGDGEELCEKVRYYLENGAERERVRANGMRRCVPAYSYDARMGELLGMLPGAGK
jgi:spore maturation protein CgeB